MEMDGDHLVWIWWRSFLLFAAALFVCEKVDVSPEMR